MTLKALASALAEAEREIAELKEIRDVQQSIIRSLTQEVPS
jgi:hypothetical protein